jgi:hypothetical protein
VNFLEKFRRKLVPTRVVGVPMRAEPQHQPLVPGQDFPKGIEYLDLSYFAAQFKPEALLACDTPEKLVAFREKTRAWQELVALKAKVTGEG